MRLQGDIRILVERSKINTCDVLLCRCILLTGKWPLSQQAVVCLSNYYYWEEMMCQAVISPTSLIGVIREIAASRVMGRVTWLSLCPLPKGSKPAAKQ